MTYEAMGEFNYNTGGQTKSLRGGYCGVRALAICASMDWDAAAKHIKQFTLRGKAGSRSLSRGVFKADYEAALKALGFRWHAAPKFDGRKARCHDLTGNVIARQAGHYVAVIDGIAHDIWDCTDRMVYGYWQQEA